MQIEKEAIEKLISLIKGINNENIGPAFVKESGRDVQNTNIVHGTNNSIEYGEGIATKDNLITGKNNTIKQGCANIISGRGNISQGECSLTIGEGNKNYGSNNIILGYNNTTHGSNNITIGNNLTSTDQDAIKGNEFNINISGGA